jgi:hypothetical protein
MKSLFVSLALVGMMVASAQAPDTLEKSNRLRRVTEAGSRIVLDRLPDTSTISIQVFWSLRDVPLAWRSAGLPHLLEHLVGARVNDAALEGQGALMVAGTLREAIMFRFDGPKSAQSALLREAEGLGRAGRWAADDLRKERLTLREESALVPSESRESERAWAVQIPERPNPFGRMSELDTYGPAELHQLYDLMLQPDRWTVSVAGPIDLEDLEPLVRKLIPTAKEPVSELAVEPYRPTPPEASSALALALPGWDDPIAVARTAVGLSLSSLTDRVRFFFTPQADESLATMVLRQGRWAEFWESDEVDAAEVVAAAPLVGEAWFKSQMADPGSSAFLHGYLMSQNRDARPDAFRQALSTLRPADFERAWKTWRTAPGGRN